MNIISRPIFDGHYHGEKYLIRVSARTRGEEMAEYLGAKFNPTVCDDGIRIFVKPRNLKKVRDGDYVDIIDGIELVEQLRQRPKIKVITMSLVEHECLSEILENELHLIHHPHINFENIEHKKGDRLVGGIVGKPSGYANNLYEKIKARLAKEGIEFTKCYNFQTRDEMVKYYASIDFLVIWFPEWEARDQWYRHPTKILNAMSFGVPSLAHPIAGYKEVEGFYIPIETIDDIVDKIGTKLPDIRKEAEKYHISKIAEKYKQLW
jgi:glycosyltransferase involved in cell wall biosynthesis